MKNASTMDLDANHPEAMCDPEAAISAVDLEKSFGTVRAVAGLALTIEMGESVVPVNSGYYVEADGSQSCPPARCRWSSLSWASCSGPPPLLALDAANLRSLRNQFAAVRRS